MTCQLSLAWFIQYPIVKQSCQSYANQQVLHNLACATKNIVQIRTPTSLFNWILLVIAAGLMVALTYANFGPRHDFGQYVPADFLLSLDISREVINFIRGSADKFSHLIAGSILAAIALITLKPTQERSTLSFLVVLSCFALIVFSFAELSQYLVRLQLWCEGMSPRSNTLGPISLCSSLQISFFGTSAQAI